jgi:hypothetical protein
VDAERQVRVVLLVLVIVLLVVTLIVDWWRNRS